MTTFTIGNPVEKVTGDYTFSGRVVAVVTKRSGAIRYVVEDERGLLFIFNGEQLRLRNQPSVTTKLEVCCVCNMVRMCIRYGKRYVCPACWKRVLS